MYKIILTFFSVIIIFLVGMYSGYKLITPNEIIKEVEVIKNVDKIIYRDYSKVDCCEIAKGYDESFMDIKYNVNSMNEKYTNIDLTWRLYERNGSQNINVPVNQSGNFKFYLGLGLGTVAIGAISYKVMR